MISIVSQDTFLGNNANMNSLIGILEIKVEAANFMVKQATDDEDTLMSNTAIGISSKFDSVILVDGDVELLIRLTVLSTFSNIYTYSQTTKGKNIAKNIVNTTYYRFNSRR